MVKNTYLCPATDYMETFLDSLLKGRYTAEKKSILSLCEKGATYSLSDLARELGTSIPKITRIVSDMEQTGLLADLGKQESSSGRRPSVYGLNPAIGYFIGVEVGQDSLALAVTDFTGRLLHFLDGIPYTLTNTEESVLGLCAAIKKQVRKFHLNPALIRSVGVNLTGRVNHQTGYTRGATHFNSTCLEHFDYNKWRERVNERKAAEAAGPVLSAGTGGQGFYVSCTDLSRLFTGFRSVALSARTR